MTRKVILCMIVLLAGPACPLFGAKAVRIWEEPLVLPTYQVHAADVNPMFERPLSYQGAKKSIYPYPLQDNLSNERSDRSYNAVYLENEYIKLCVLPELGGKLFFATDKTNGYEMFYRQHVIKPSNIGMLGAWISGGIEWCVFHHHRASTFMPVDYALRSNSDGSKTIWIGEIEPRHRMRWSIGITLYPGKSCVEADIRMFNRTETANSILYWANVATHANDDYQVFFPPSTEFGTYHAKNDFVHWPVAQENYLGREYTGVDLSWWKNHPRPVSIFAHNIQEGFLAGYDHGKKAGTLHVGNHHIVTGAKLWEWGPGPEGSTWDTKVLTDSDGPYAELMAGAFSDNQPDYSWIGPYEVKQARQYWCPVREIGGVKSANLDAALNLEVQPDGKATLGLNCSATHEKAKVILMAKAGQIFEEVVDIDPAHPVLRRIDLPADTKEADLEAVLQTKSGHKLIAYKPVKPGTSSELPKAVEAPGEPNDIETIEELYLTGLRIKQFHNARLNPNDYFEEALRRDPSDSRCSIQLGLDAARRGLYDRAAERFTAAIKRISKNYTRPRDCQAYYQLGAVLKKQGNYDEAYSNFYRAVWDYSFRSAAYYNLAEISCLRGDFQVALGHIDDCLATNALNIKALSLRSAILRRLGRPKEALAAAEKVLAMDPLDYWGRNECCLALTDKGAKGKARRHLTELKRIMNDHAESYLELAMNYVNCGMPNEAINVLSRAVAIRKTGISDYPTIHYCLAYLYEQKGDSESAGRHYNRARRCPVDYCFPFRLEMLNVLGRAVEANPRDGRAHYYLGNLLYDLQPERAIAEWARAAELEPSLAIAHRNLGWGRYYTENNIAAAIASYEKAIKHNPEDASYYYELDQLYERNATAVEQRLKTLETNHEHVKKREDSLIREIIVLVQAGKYDKALDYLQQNYFHIQEGNRRLHDTYVEGHLLRGLDFLAEQEYHKALKDFLAADEYPENHQIGRDTDYRMNPQIYYCLGSCYKALGQTADAEAAFKKASQQRAGKTEYAYYKAMSHRELGQEDEALDLFDKLIRDGQERLNEKDKVDFFAKFGSAQSPGARKSDGYYMIGLGHLGKTEDAEANEAFEKAVELDAYNIWARRHLKQAARKQP
ncbi:MAG: DUF5107 domain-containing protein [Sedimentisphaerales bacterium]|nr:DUF5107 domain-containing protein [Sedimentisphaerales bacterium]